MDARLAGKVAVVTGAARGQGRSHCVQLAVEGVDVIAVDVCEQLETVPYAMSTPQDMEETVRMVERLDRRIIARQADVRDFGALEEAVAAGVAELGRLDIVVANAGIGSYGQAADIGIEQWNVMIETNLSGVWHTVKASLPHIRAGGRGGSIILTSSICGVLGTANLAHYVSAKHGVVGLMRVLANELGPEKIRVNTVNPTTVDTPIFHNSPTYALFAAPGAATIPTRDEVAPLAAHLNILPVPWVEPVDVSNAVVFLASDLARYVTGVVLPVDAGAIAKTGGWS
jgi:(+)-trans-carveol dehydrogenase